MRLLIVLLFTLITYGCSNTPPKPKTVYVPKIYVPKIPNALLDKCHVTPPPDKQLYKSLPPHKRELLLSKLIINLYGDLNACNSQIEYIGRWYNSVRTKSHNVSE